MDPEVLPGGLANAGSVVRTGPHVRRPLPGNATTLHALLRFLRASSDVEAPVPIAVEEHAEVVEYLPGDVGLPPYPGWVNSDRMLETLGGLLRRFHDATTRWEIPPGAAWSQAFADPAGGPVICHNDVCIENVVARDAAAAALLDFDFAAPGRRVWDVAQAARYWIPLTDPELPAAADRDVLDPIGRLRRFADAYGLGTGARRQFVEVVLEAEQGARRFVAGEAARGVPGFTAVWDEAAVRRFDQKIAWIESQADAIADALLAA
ncbi:MAG: phosphotransferase [Nocardiopsaceae bacterium]|nr:phosphotransferase [Nocardiopsaceae bacterium]